MNNLVIINGELIGYRCSICDEVKSKMWGTICNQCRILIQITDNNSKQG